MSHRGGTSVSGRGSIAAPARSYAAVTRHSLTKTTKTPTVAMSRSVIHHRPGMRELLARHQVKRRPDMGEIRILPHSKNDSHHRHPLGHNRTQKPPAGYPAYLAERHQRTIGTPCSCARAARR